MIGHLRWSRGNSILSRLPEMVVVVVIVVVVAVVIVVMLLVVVMFLVVVLRLKLVMIKPTWSLLARAPPTKQMYRRKMGKPMQAIPT